METISSKMIGVILFIICGFYIALNIFICISDVTSTRELMNNVANYINKVTDTGVCSDKMLSDFYLSCSTSGVPVDVKVKRYEKVINPVSKDTESGTQLTYTPNSDLTVFNQGDIVQVEVKFLSPTGLRRVVWDVLRLLQPQTEYEFAGMVRN